MRRVVRAGLLLKGAALTPVENASLVIEDGLISDIQPHFVAGTSDDVEDYAGRVVMPGLIDSHVHLQLTPCKDHQTGREVFERDRSTGRLPLRAMRNARAALGAGITTVRDCGSEMSMLAVRDAMADGDVGPRILAAGNPITTTAGHCHWFGRHVDTEEEMRKTVRGLIEHGVDVIKVMTSGGNMTPGSNSTRPQYSASELGIAVAEAHRLGRLVVAHALNVESIRNCVEAGVDSIDHCSWQLPDASLRYDEALGAKLVASGSRVGITGSGILRVLLDRGEAGLAELRGILDAHRRLFLAGASVSVHSDAGVRFTPIDRFDLSIKVMMHGLGISPRDALVAATGAAAEAIGLQEETGTIDVGKRADLLVLNANPLDDIDNIRRVDAVFRDGMKLVDHGRAVIPMPAGERSP